MTTTTEIAAPAEGEVKTTRLYHPRAVLVAALLGGPVAGAMVMAMNYRRLGKPGAAKGIVIAALVVVAGVMGVSLAMGGGGAGTVVAVALVAMTYHFAKTEQGPAVERHVRAGGRLGSPLLPAGLGLAVCAAVIGGALGWAVVTGNVPAGALAAQQYSAMSVGAYGKVLYPPDHFAEARRVATALNDLGMGESTRQWNVVLAAGDGGGLELRFFVAADRLDRPETRATFAEISRKINGPSPWVRVVLYDPDMKEHRAVP